jgi:hypothetical protein
MGKPFTAVMQHLIPVVVNKILLKRRDVFEGNKNRNKPIL